MGGFRQMYGLGWSDVVGHPMCPDYPGYEQRCFRTTTVDGQPPEQDFARAQGCAPINQPCSTSPAGNPGLVWCCPPGWPRPPGSPPLEPGQTPPAPPAPPGIGRWFQQSSSRWWFWLGALGLAGIAFFGYKEYEAKREELELEEEF